MPEIGVAKPDIDERLNRVCERFAEELGDLSHDAILREALLRAAVGRVSRALANRFEGYEDILSDTLLQHAHLVAGHIECSKGASLHH